MSLPDPFSSAMALAAYTIVVLIIAIPAAFLIQWLVIRIIRKRIPEELKQEVKNANTKKELETDRARAKYGTGQFRRVNGGEPEASGINEPVAVTDRLVQGTGNNEARRRFPILPDSSTLRDKGRDEEVKRKPVQDWPDFS